jgi:oxygen-independent coproporphyrinogen-3 oxidase
MPPGMNIMKFQISPSLASIAGTTVRTGRANLTWAWVPLHKTLTESDRHNEYIMISLRKKEGIAKDDYVARFGEKQLAVLTSAVQKFKNGGSIHEDNLNFSLTRQGKLFADGIASELFI